jgi:hypothetical protein
MEDLQAVGPERRVANLDVGASGVELREVEQEVDLDLPLLAGELGEAHGEGIRVERFGDGCEHDRTSVHPS